MSKTNIFIAVALINIVVIAGIVNELGLGDDEVDTSTIVTAKLSIYYKNAGDNDTLIFESLTTSESTVFGLLMAGTCLLYTSPSPRDLSTSRMPSSA